MPVSVRNHLCLCACKQAAAPVSNCTILQVAVLKQTMMMKPDKLRGECENSQVMVCAEELEQLREQLQSCDKEWQERLGAESDKWQARLEEHEQDVETEQAKMAEAVAGKICLCFLEIEKNKLQFTE